MSLAASNFTRQLSEQLSTFNSDGAETLVNELIEGILDDNSILTSRDAEKILNHLRNGRLFELTKRSAEAFQRSGLQSFRIKRLYAMSFIDLGEYDKALSVSWSDWR